MSQDKIIVRLARELGIRDTQARSTVALLDEGNTIPFIARYRKEATGELDENVLRNLEERLGYLRNLESRKAEVIRLIEELGKLTPELRAAIEGADKLQEVEDLYRPYRPKRRTRASIAKEKGLEPLAQMILEQNVFKGAPEEHALAFVNAEKGVNSPEEALAGARDIVAEVVSDDAWVRSLARDLTFGYGVISTAKAPEAEGREFEMYHEFSEPVKSLPPHRILAINRGEREKALSVKIEAPVPDIIARLRARHISEPRSVFTSHLDEAVDDGYRRLVEPAIEREVRSQLTDRADERAIQLFGTNLKNLLLQPPIRGMVVMGIDPGFRTGCKIAVVDDTGKILDVGVIYPHPPQEKAAETFGILKRLILRHKVDLIAIGNGTASRETEAVVSDLIPEMDRKVAYLIVSEAGASIYSASRAASEELPEYDVSLRGAVSIARRALDPLAELVKIEPKSIGVGQYQHDVDQKRLTEALGAVVESAVNSVGVDLNTASASLLQYVAGIKGVVAKAIVAYREQNGRFKSRNELRKVSGLGDKTFVQCAGFLRIAGGKEPLDDTPVHPESYSIAEAILKAAGQTKEEMARGGSAALRDSLKVLSPEKIARDLGAGVPTVRDILEALAKPGRDPRDELPKPVFHTQVRKLEDLKPGMSLQGTVRNVVDFGAFVDIGVGQDGLVHISELSNKYIKHPSEVVAVGDQIAVRVLKVDLDRGKGRISLSMKSQGV
jgi:uncharacterized protein